MASFRKRGDYWYFIIDVGRDLVTGQRRQRTVSKDSQGRKFETEREARKAALKMEQDIERGMKFDSVTLGDLLTQFFERVVKEKVSEVTYEGQMLTARNHILPYLGKAKIDKINDLHIENLYERLSDNGVSRGMIRNVSIVLSKVFKYALKKRLIVDNPMRLVTTPKYKPVKPSVWSPEHVQTFLAANTNSKFFELYLLAANTGMRRGELLGLTWDNVDFERSTVTVNQSLKYTSNSKHHIGSPKTENSRRTIHVPQHVMKVLKEYKARQMEGVNIVFDNLGEHYWVGEASRQFKLDCEGLGLPHSTLHGLRHAHATKLLQIGFSPIVVAERLGDTVEQLMRTYAHALPTAQKAVAEALEKLWTTGIESGVTPPKSGDK